MSLFKKISRGFRIFKLTNFKYFRASQLVNKDVEFKIKNQLVTICGNSVLSMLFEIVSEDNYHLKKQRNPQVIFDVGANVGIFSIYAATLFPNCDIYAFEPVLSNFNLLKENTSKFRNIHCFKTALSNYNGIGYVGENIDPTAFHTSAVNGENIREQCNMVKLESFIYEHNIKEIDVLKLDCEGSEYDIVQSDLTNVKQIVGEYHTVESKKPKDLKQYFMKKDFSLKQWGKSENSIAGIFWLINKKYT